MDLLNTGNYGSIKCSWAILHELFRKIAQKLHVLTEQSTKRTLRHLRSWSKARTLELFFDELLVPYTYLRYLLTLNVFGDDPSLGLLVQAIVHSACELVLTIAFAATVVWSGVIQMIHLSQTSALN